MYNSLNIITDGQLLQNTTAEIIKFHGDCLNLDGRLLIESACLKLGKDPEGHPIESFITEAFNLSDLEILWFSQLHYMQETGADFKACYHAANYEVGFL